MFILDFQNIANWSSVNCGNELKMQTMFCMWIHAAQTPVNPSCLKATLYSAQLQSPNYCSHSAAGIEHMLQQPNFILGICTI